MTDPVKMNWQALMPIIVTITVQTLALVWWTATTSAVFEQRLTHLEKIPVTSERITRLETVVNEMYRRFDRFEEKLDALVPVAPKRPEPHL